MAQEPPRRVLGYCRVSTRAQASDESTSLEVQESTIRAYCEKKGWDVVDVIRDTASGASLKRVDTLLDLLKKKQANVLVVHRLDRLTRLEALDLYALMKDLDQAGVRLVSTEEAFDTSKPAGRLMFDILSSVARLGRDMIVERARAGIQTKKQDRRRYSRIVPFGFKDVDGKLEENPAEMKWVRRMFLWRSRGTKLNKIARRLNKKYRVKTRQGKDWRPSTIWYVLRNKIYDETLARKRGRPRKKNEVKS